MAIRIVNRLITPYSDKDDLKVIWGDTQTFEFTLPSPHQAGDAYHLGIDQDRVVYPPSRPLCAYTKAFEVDGGTLTMTLTYNTGRLRDYVCKLRKPTPIYIQLDRVRGGKCETLLLDTLLALPSVLDSQNTVVEGDPLAELLEAKMDKPYAEGNPGQILSLDEDGKDVWRNQTQADYDESDSAADSYIKNKPVISKVGHTGEYGDLLNPPVISEVGHTGSYNDLLDKPHIPTDPVQADYDESDSSALSYIRHKPVISTVGHTGSYDDLLDKPNLSVYSLVTETGNKISMSIDDNYDLVVNLLDKNNNILSTQDIDLPIESMIVNASYSNGVLTLTLQNGNTLDVDISDIVSGLVPDTRTVNGHALSADVTVTASDLGLATVATTGSYDDLLDKPHIPVDPVQADYDESDSDALDYIKNKPNLSVYVEKEAGKGLSTNDFTDGDKAKLGGIENGAQVNVNADWDESDSTDDSYIRHKPHLAAVATSGSYNDLTDKPVIPEQVQSDWDESDSTAVDYIKNKPAIPVQAKADWDESDSTAASYIQNKPALAAVATTGNYWSLTNRPAVPYNTGDYFTIWNNTANSAGSTVRLEKVGSPRDNTFQYCTNGSTDAWSDYTLGSTITIPQYGYVKFRNKDYGKLLSNGNAANYYHFVITGNVWLSGNLASMKDRTMSAHAYAGGADLYAMFKDNAAITDASGLIIPINDVNVNTYASMFENCTGMVYGPAELPAMKFSGVNCYMAMFKGCTSLKVAPRLPAVTLTNSCYKQMFYGCTSLIDPPPELPANTLEANCFYQMFKGCTALKKSPDIKATTLANSSMYEMFSGCSALKEVKIAFSNFAPTGVTTPTTNWLNGVSTGVIEMPGIVSTSNRSADTVPSLWFIRNIAYNGYIDWTTSTENSRSMSYVWYQKYNLVEASSSSSYTVNFNTNTTPVLTVASSLTLTTYGGSKLNSCIAYSEVVIDLAAGATVTAGTNFELVDQPVAGKRNICIVRQQGYGTTARLYVVDTMDLPN